MKKIFVTGANSLLGTNLIHTLLYQNYDVVGLVRNLSSFKGMNHPNLKLVQGNIMDDLSTLMSDCEILIHTAAETGQQFARYEHYRKTNVEGSINLMEAAIQNKIKKFVFISTANTIVESDLENTSTENLRYPYNLSYYAQSKLEAENSLRAYKERIFLIIINPTFIIGPYDSKPSSGKIILMGAHKNLLFYPPGGKNFVHVQDVVDGIINSLQFAENGTKNLISGVNLTFHDFFQKMLVLNHQKTIMIKIPKAVLLGIGRVGEILRNLGLNLNINYTNMYSLCIENFYLDHTSISKLKITQRPIEKAISEALDYFKTAQHKN